MSTLNTDQVVRVRAPGKLVLWGEYAVLAGACAGVLAVDREIQVQLSPATEPTGDGRWQIQPLGFAAPTTTINADWFVGPEPAADHSGHLLWHAAQAAHFSGSGNFAQNGTAQLQIDSQAFYHNAQKLGLGSSAAVCVALYALCCERANTPMSLDSALAAHRNAQAGAGSGIDVAASYYGGLLHFKRHFSINRANPSPSIARAQWPAELYWQAWFTGHSADTREHLGRFSDWRTTADTATLDDLVTASEYCAQYLSASALGDYCQALRAFDQASQLGIYAKGHENLHKLSLASGLLYKPCGAGGGDLGVAISDDPERLQAFAQQAQNQSYTAIPLGMAEHGVRTSTEHHLPNP